MTVNAIKFEDLFSLLLHSNIKVKEMAIYSLLIIFKDICPSYRLRPINDSEKDVILKKETKRLKEYERNLLTFYSRFLKYLSTSVEKGARALNNRNTRKKISNSDLLAESNPDAMLAIICLTCQGELLKALHHFNFRSELLSSIISSAFIFHPEVEQICIGTLKHVIASDINSELSYELTVELSKQLVARKFEVPESTLSLLSLIKVQVHADEAAAVRVKAKREKRKRRRNSDEVDLGLLEADGAISSASKSIAQRFQADCLHELSLVYFRSLHSSLSHSNSDTGSGVRADSSPSLRRHYFPSIVCNLHLLPQNN